MGSIFKGFGSNKTYVGHCEGGIIYSGNGTSNPIGRYENGCIYNQFKEHVGSYNSGSIYNQFNEHIASYKYGSVYNEFLNAAVGKTQIGSYSSDPAEAAALVLLFIGDSKATSEHFQENSSTTHNTHSYSQTSNNTTIIDILFLIIALFFKILSFGYVYIAIPILSSLTWITFLYGILFNLIVDAMPLVIVFCTIIGISHCAFWPYYIKLIIKRGKKQITTRQLLGFCWKWFLKGPLAYKDLAKL